MPIDCISLCPLHKMGGLMINDDPYRRIKKRPHLRSFLLLRIKLSSSQYKRESARLGWIFCSLCLRRHSKQEKFVPVSPRNITHLFYLVSTISDKPFRWLLKNGFCVFYQDIHQTPWPHCDQVGALSVRHGYQRRPYQ